LRMGGFGGRFIVQFFGILAHGMLLMNGEHKYLSYDTVHGMRNYSIKNSRVA
jgi:hypothetical protein